MTATSDLDICPFCGKGRLAPELEQNGIPQYYTCTNCCITIPYKVQHARVKKQEKLKNSK